MQDVATGCAASHQGTTTVTSPTPSQFRAARAMLDWSKIELAKAAGVSVATVMWAEGRDPGRVTSGTRVALRAALETAGVHFTDDEGHGSGLRLRPR